MYSPRVIRFETDRRRNRGMKRARRIGIYFNHDRKEKTRSDNSVHYHC